MAELDAYEAEVLESYEKGDLQSLATPDELARIKAAARLSLIHI